MRSSVIGITSDFSLINLLKNGMTLPLEPITFPYLTTEKRHPSAPDKWLAATNILSEASLLAPYKLIGLAALSVDKAITFLTFLEIDACTTFSAPITFVCIHSNGLYSAAGTCFNAAAWTT